MGDFCEGFLLRMATMNCSISRADQDSAMILGRILSMISGSAEMRVLACPSESWPLARACLAESGSFKRRRWFEMTETDLPPTR